MKTRINIFLLAWTLLLLAACVREPLDPTPSQKGIRIPYSATVTEGVSTRASLDIAEHYIFSAGDRLHVIAREGEDIKIYGCLTINSGAGESTATFTGELTCAEDYLPVDGTPLTATLLSAGSPEGFYTLESNGSLTGPTYPANAVASSFQDAVSKYGVFTAEGTYGAATFSLAQQSAFLLFKIRCDKGDVPAGQSVEINFYNAGETAPLRSASVTAAAAGSFSRVSFAMAFPGGSTTLSGAKLDVKWGNEAEDHKEFNDITNKSLVANNYYNVSRDAVEIYQGFRIKGPDTGSAIVTFNYNFNYDGIEYSLDNGHNWHNSGADNCSFELFAGQEACIRGTRTTYRNGRPFNDNYAKPYNKPIFVATQKVYIAGDISSLFAEGLLTEPYALQGAFSRPEGNGAIDYIDIDPDDPLILPWSELTTGCFVRMFFNCTSLTWAPELPATVLAEHCYYNMFRQCTGIKSYLFSLPAMTLTQDCYREIFRGCTNLEVVADNLFPATTLATSCYQQLFADDKKLTRAPELPAETLVSECYKQMFSGCEKLNYIKCLATTGINATNLQQWVNKVSSEGTFVKSSAVTSWPTDTGANGIPSGWTVVDD